MSTSVGEVTGSASVKAVPSAHPAKASSGEVSLGILEGLPRTRERLVDTMETLAHKVDLSSGVKDKWHATKDTVQAKIGKVKRRLDEGKETVHDKADEVTRQAKSLTNHAREQAPAPVAGGLTHLTQAVRQRPVPAAAMVFTVFAILLLRRLLHRAE